MIILKECGHSQETSTRWHKNYPNRCFYCEYLQKHPRPVKTVSDKKKAHLVELNSRLKAERLLKRGKLSDATFEA